MVAFSIFYTLALAASLPLSNAYSFQKRANISQQFQDGLSPGAQIFYPSDPNYANETTQRWTVYEEPTYVAAIKPAIPQDVQNTVKTASQLGIPFLATGGGHGLPTTLHNLQNGISIDLGNFKNVTVDTAAQTATIGGGNVFSEIYDPIWDVGFELPTGSCACPGVVGVTIGGGIGRMQGLHGYILDNLISAVVVTASGDLLTVSEHEHPGLFWGIRGAGASFAIILSATYQIYPQTNGGMAMTADLVFAPNASEQHFNILKQFSVDMPAELALFTDMNHNTAHGGLNILFNAVYYGPEATGRSLIQPFIDNNPFITNISYIPAKDLVSTSLFGLFADAQCTKGKHVNTYTVGTLGLDVSTYQAHFQNLSAFYEKYPQAQASTTFLETLPKQAVVAQNKNATSVPWKHREIDNYVLLIYNYADQSIDEEVNQFAQDARAAFAATGGFGDLTLYDTYAHGDEGPEVLYREHLPRLQRLKNKWDPQNLFEFMNPVVPFS